jgi:hypothetical protein
MEKSISQEVVPLVTCLRMGDGFNVSRVAGKFTGGRASRNDTSCA